MRSDALFAPVKIVSYVVLLAMLATFIYVAYISLTHWHGIAV